MTRPLLLGLCSLSLFAQSLRPELYNDMRWRHIGPFRAGRTVAASGIASQPNVFYIAANNGGVWKTDDYGHTWAPLFDNQPTGSIGALAIAPSDPKVIYVGSGEGLHRPDLSVGNGMYKSLDGGKTWNHLGLDDAQQIPAILVDPRNPNRVYVAALGHPYGPNAERGVYRSDNGGTTWTKILYKDENTGAIELAFAPDNPDIIYASLWEAREGPWENGAWQGKNSGLFKSTDAGKTWTKLEKGLPTVAQGLGRIGLGISPSNPSTLYAMVDANASLGGVYRSDDAGATWRKRNGEMRVWGRGSDFAWVRVHPRDKETIFVANTSAYKSTDGGKTFTAWKGAPGGDDYHTIWINPINPETILLASDQGATITVNGGRTWSSWYNQPTAQFYHVITDNQWPYWVYGGQQESGSAGVKSRGDNGAITFRDWRTVGVEEYGYVAPDPLDANIIYGGKATRFDARTGQVQDISPILLRDARYRSIRTMPLLFSPVDPHLLYLGANVVFQTANGGKSWDVISPDLTRESYEPPASIGIFSSQAKNEANRRGVVYSIGPSHQDVNTIWAGTDDGLIHITRDGGKAWKNVTPSTLTPWSKVSQLDASHFDNNTVYAAINRIRVDDQKPHILRTHDGGSTWTEIVKGLPDGPINTVREDAVHKGLLFAGSELAVYFSIDDGDNWMPLRLNMPATSIRDLVAHNDDVVVGTHGRGFWILDDITPLRQMSAQTAAAPAMLFRPQMAVRVRRNVATDTPLPPEEPAGQNPPDGAILNYWLAKPAAGRLTIEILDLGGKLVRRYASDDKAPPVDPELNVPTYWLRTPKAPATAAGMHRFVWDLHYAPPAALNFGYPISAIYGDTPREPLGPGVLPGEYTVRLTADGTSYTQSLKVRMDPRVTTPAADLEEQFRLSLRVYDLIDKSFQALQEVKKTRDPRAAAFDGAASRFRRGAGGDNFAALNGQLTGVLDVLQGADAAPTTQATAAVTQIEDRLNKLLSEWHELRGTLQ
jgi:photosystem II stability/assembly factor-like uncharacterized protein